jgi:hypothetical protein
MLHNSKFDDADADTDTDDVVVLFSGAHCSEHLSLVSALLRSLFLLRQ